MFIAQVTARDVIQIAAGHYQGSNSCAGLSTMPRPNIADARRWRTVLRVLGSLLFVAAGINHFVHPDFYRKIIPPGLPTPDLLVAVSGLAEIAGGIGLLIPRARRAAGWGLIALLVAVFPANVYMAACPDRIPGLNVPGWLLWLRLPLQAVFVGWVWVIGVQAGGSRRDAPTAGARRD